MDIQGFCLIKNDADCSSTAVMGHPDLWRGQIVPAMELNDNSQSALVIRDANMAMFDYKEIERKFKCVMHGDVMMPVGLTEPEKLIYFSYVMGRNGGYNAITKKMVLAQSLHRGEFTDSVLWMKGQDPDVVAGVNALKELAKQRTDGREKQPVRDNKG